MLYGQCKWIEIKVRTVCDLGYYCQVVLSMPTYSVHQTIVSLCASMKRMFVGGECRGGPTRSHDYREYCYEAKNLVDTRRGR